MGSQRVDYEPAVDTATIPMLLKLVDAGKVEAGPACYARLPVERCDESLLDTFGNAATERARHLHLHAVSPPQLDSRHAIDTS